MQDIREICRTLGIPMSKCVPVYDSFGVRQLWETRDNDSVIIKEIEQKGYTVYAICRDTCEHFLVLPPTGPVVCKLDDHIYTVIALTYKEGAITEESIIIYTGCGVQHIPDSLVAALKDAPVMHSSCSVGIYCEEGGSLPSSLSEDTLLYSPEEFISVGMINKSIFYVEDNKLRRLSL